MALYVIGDLHLSLEANKPMDVFGGNWVNYVDKLREGLKVIGPEDTTILLGDLSWAMSLATAVKDFQFMNAIPGEKSSSREITTTGGQPSTNLRCFASSRALNIFGCCTIRRSSTVILPCAAPEAGSMRKSTTGPRMKRCSGGS